MAFASDTPDPFTDGDRWERTQTRGKDELRDFVALVTKMRAAQRAWFNPRTRTQAVLEESKKLEHEVDREAERLGETPEPQGRLFS
jgi:hypothetical protein